MIPTVLPIYFRSEYESGLTNTQIDENFRRVRDAILGISDSLSSGGRVVIGDEPPLAERNNVLWIGADLTTFKVWDGDAWNVVADNVWYAESTGADGSYTVDFARDLTYSELTGRLIVFKANHTNTADAATLRVIGNADPVSLRPSVGREVGVGAITVGNLWVVVYTGEYFQVTTPSDAESATPTQYTAEATYNYTLPGNYTRALVVATAAGGSSKQSVGSQGDADGHDHFAYGGSGGHGGSVQAIFMNLTGEGPHLRIEIDPLFIKVTASAETTETGIKLYPGRNAPDYTQFRLNGSSEIVEGYTGPDGDDGGYELMRPTVGRYVAVEARDVYYGAGGKGLQAPPSTYLNLYPHGDSAIPFVVTINHSGDPGPPAEPGNGPRVWILPYK